jgi:hypothetical protein
MKNSASMFHNQMHQNVLGDPEIAMDTKTQVQSNMSQRLFFVVSALGPPEHEK